MMDCIGGHLTYLTMYATDSTFKDSEGVHRVRLMYSKFIVSLIVINCYFLQALVAAYCDLLDFYVKVRNVFPKKQGTLPCRWTWLGLTDLLLTGT